MLETVSDVSLKHAADHSGTQKSITWPIVHLTCDMISIRAEQKKQGWGDWKSCHEDDEETDVVGMMFPMAFFIVKSEESLLVFAFLFMGWKLSFTLWGTQFDEEKVMKWFILYISWGGFRKGAEKCAKWKLLIIYILDYFFHWVSILVLEENVGWCKQTYSMRCTKIKIFEAPFYTCVHKPI